jgi:hypothetical protein
MQAKAKLKQLGRGAQEREGGQQDQQALASTISEIGVSSAQDSPSGNRSLGAKHGWPAG